MKRTSLMLDEKLLQEATQATGAKTYSAAVNAALGEVLRQAKARGIRSLKGIGGWEGDLSAMRGDSDRASRRGSRS